MKHGTCEGPGVLLGGMGVGGVGPWETPCRGTGGPGGGRGNGGGWKELGVPDHGTGAGLWIQGVGEGRGTWPAALGWGYTGRCLGIGVVTLYQDIN